MTQAVPSRHGAGDLNVARSAHTATLLPNGQVLIAGGFGRSGVLNSAELYGAVSPGTIVPAFTGNWFDPAQNGHGLLIEVLPNNQFLAAWFAFSPAGSSQAWFTGVGTYSGDTAIISNVVQPTGGRWIPNFDPDRIVDSPWGTLKFTFTDCDHGKVDFSSTQPGYGSGSMNLTRLTRPASLSCFVRKLADPVSIAIGALGQQKGRLEMSGSTGFIRSSSGSALALAVLTCGFVVAVQGQERIASEVRIAALATKVMWVPTGALDMPRMFHSATLLGTGKVLVVGGIANAAILTGAELYDPASGTWSPTGNMSVPRVGHTATLLPSGKVLVVGGEPNAETAEIYDPTTGSWALTDNLGTARIGHTATLLQSGRVLVVGGYVYGIDGESLVLARSAELFDPATGTWSPTGSPFKPRYWHTATLLNDGKVLIARGSVDDYYIDPTSTAELYDPGTGTWSAVATSLLPTWGHTATLLPNGTVLLTGGETSGRFGQNSTYSAMCALFDPATGRWTDTGKLRTPRQMHTATLLPTGDVLIAGGVNPTPLAAAERFDVNTGKWTATATLGEARGAHSAILLPDGKVLIAGGGVGGTLVLASAELYGDFPPGTIIPAFTGSWFDPAQNGHGLLVEVLPNNQFLAAWFAFNPAGTAQAWFTGVGTYNRSVATISNVTQPTGGRWIPNFDPSRIIDNAWGSLKFTFTDCNHGKVEFASSSGYGTGSMNLTRLTQPAGLACP